MLDVAEFHQPPARSVRLPIRRRVGLTNTTPVTGGTMGNDAVAAIRRNPSSHRGARLAARLATATLVACVVLMATASCIGEDDLTLDQRHRGLSEQLMCPVCDSQTIDQSSAAVAEDMKNVVWQKLEAGESNESIRSYFVARYGEAVLASPNTAGFNLTAWTFPALLAIVGMTIVGVAYLRMRLPARMTRRRVLRAGAGATAAATIGLGDASDDPAAADSDPDLARFLALVDEEMQSTRADDGDGAPDREPTSSEVGQARESDAASPDDVGRN